MKTNHPLVNAGYHATLSRLSKEIDTPMGDPKINKVTYGRF